MTRVLDPTSVAGRPPRVERRVPLVVVGAGAAGVAAATEAARAGVEVLLLDEHPLDVDLMAMDVPLYFGQRMSPSVRNRAATMARVVAASPGLAEADEAGVDVRLGVSVWGAFRNGPTSRELEGPLLGLADLERSWLVGYDRLVVAAGARDVGMGFPGWEHAGTMGAAAACALMTRYGALASRRMVVVGSGTLGLRTAALALESGIDVGAVVEVSPRASGDQELRRQLEAKGVPFRPAHTLQAARGRTGEVEAVVLVPVDADLRPVAGAAVEVACDTICLAIGLAPQVELLDLLGCRLAFRSALGGFVPEVDEALRTSVPDVFVAGDCAGVHDGMVADPTIAGLQGRLAGLAAAHALGAGDPDRLRVARAELDAVASTRPDETEGYRRTWLRSLVNAGGWDVNACQCEEVTRRDLVDVQPPRYLAWESRQMRARGLGTLLEDGPLNQDQVKRLTRAGMGPCQGRRCREQVALLLAEHARVPVGRIPLPSYRAPIRPLPLSVLWDRDESPEVRDHWVAWFGIPTQFAPHWERRVDGQEGATLVGLGRVAAPASGPISPEGA
ncbi:MAG: NAD(P)/FAD-dependent oxidoreductase [Candidatus Rokuibacteriota bacterium]